jgi:hypothetical protein
LTIARLAHRVILEPNFDRPRVAFETLCAREGGDGAGEAKQAWRR